MNGEHTVALVLAALALAALVAIAALMVWPWRIEATLKAATKASLVSFAGGLEVAGFSFSAAAILGGPGVVAIHLRSRELWRRSIAHASAEALVDWLDDVLTSPESSPTSAGRLAKRLKEWLLPRTDVKELPGAGLRVLLGCRDVSLHGAIALGFADPALTGKTAAWLFPLAGILSPFGILDVSFDWTGKNRIDGDVEASLRVVPGRVALEGLRFARRHVHLLRPVASVSSTIQPVTPTR